MAKFRFTFGCMNAGKSKTLIEDAKLQDSMGDKVLCVKPRVDTRNNSDFIKSKDNSEIKCITVDKIDFEELTNYNVKTIFVDEVQMFNEEDMDVLASIVDSKNINVCCYGLLKDYKQQMFPASKKLIELGSDLEMISMPCEIYDCTNMATHNTLEKDGKIITIGDSVVIDDGTVVYRSVCRKCYIEAISKENPSLINIQ